MFQVYSSHLVKHIFVFKFFFHFMLLKDIEYSPLCYAVDCVVYFIHSSVSLLISNSQFSPSQPIPLLVIISLFSGSVSLAEICIFEMAPRLIFFASVLLTTL